MQLDGKSIGSRLPPLSRRLKSIVVPETFDDAQRLMTYVELVRSGLVVKLSTMSETFPGVLMLMCRAGTPPSPDVGASDQVAAAPFASALCHPADQAPPVSICWMLTSSK